nr:thioredoxin domain-containing protein [Minwuia sp. IMCC3060]
MFKRTEPPLCSDCRRFHEEVYPALTEEWVFSGKVRFVLREYPLDRYALQASMLARCSGEQNFFGVVDVLFERQPSWSKIANPTAALRQIGMQFGVSGQAFDACMADESLVDMILSSRLEGHQRMRVTSTPTLFVNGQMVSNPMDYSEISGRIRSALQR